MNRVRRSAMDDPAFASDSARQEKLGEAIEKIVAAHKATGVINDQAFASLKVASLRRSGGSARRIAEKLRHKGVAGNVVGEALRGHAEEEGEGDEAGAELRAARAFARKKRLGPFRERAEGGADRARKDYATLARAGFGYDVIRQVLGEGGAVILED